MKRDKGRPIGIFDSGIGGLTVARSVKRHLPGEDIVYFGDTARVPYGNKSRATVTRFAQEIMTFMMKKNVKMVIVACNTASSLSLPVLSRFYSVPVVGVIAPGVREAVRRTKNRRIGVIGTSSTISSGAYPREAAKADRECVIFSAACPLFVPVVESGLARDPLAVSIAEKYLKDLRKRKIDTLILGCTHYPILRNVISKVLGGVALVDSSRAVAREVEGILDTRGEGPLREKAGGELRCFVSDDAEGFRKTARIFLKEDITVRKVAL